MRYPSTYTRQGNGHRQMGNKKGSGELEFSQKRFEYNVGSNGEVMFPKMLGSETEYPFRFGRADAAPIAG